MMSSQALHNGLLIDPHDQKAIADALLNLVADKTCGSSVVRTALKIYTGFHGQNTVKIISPTLSTVVTAILPPAMRSYQFQKNP